jgi:hypothetical protein
MSLDRFNDLRILGLWGKQSFTHHTALRAAWQECLIRESTYYFPFLLASLCCHPGYVSPHRAPFGRSGGLLFGRPRFPYRTLATNGGPSLQRGLTKIVRTDWFITLGIHTSLRVHVLVPATSAVVGECPRRPLCCISLRSVRLTTRPLVSYDAALCKLRAVSRVYYI